MQIKVDSQNPIEIKKKNLTEEQARHIYQKVKLGNTINMSTINQEIDQDQELNR